MKVLIIGGGGREHALAWKAAQSEQVDTVFLAPGNAGSALENKLSNVDIAATDIQGLIAFVQQQGVDLTIVGPEQPLVDGVVDAFTAAGLPCFGPSQGAAQLEGSKSFTKDFLARHDIPTAGYGVFTDVGEAETYLQSCAMPIVIKADGLAAGKGVIIAQSLEEANTTVRDMLAGNAFGEAGSRVVVEEFMRGEEASFIVMVDGKNILPLATSQDHKARDDGDKGPNTGGMGAYSPAPVVTQVVHEHIMRDIMRPTVDGMASEGNTYVGFLYAGLMIDEAGQAKVVEFNCRFGDPETQPVMLRLRSDLVSLVQSALDGTLSSTEAEWDPRPAIGVVMAAGGYPESYSKGDEITGFDAVDADVKVFHAGTKEHNGAVVTNGGRVLCVTAMGDTVAQAQTHCYNNLHKISWDKAYYRNDIAYRAIAREQSE